MFGPVCTMLQKLSKCEVKAWLCWHLIILLPLPFWVKSNFGQFKRYKNVVFGHFRDSKLWIFGKLGLESYSNLLKSNSEPLKLTKLTFLTIWNHQNVISRKIGVAVKCEVKAWLFWNLIIYHQSDFMWNHILGNSNSPKMLILSIQEVLNFDFSIWATFKSKVYQNSQSRAQWTPH